MSGGVSLTATSQSYSVFSPPRTPSRIHQHRCSVDPRSSREHPLFSSNLKLFSSGSPKINLRCNSTGDSGDNESRTILDAFFLGKAVAEALNERIESAVGEFLSTVGRLQAEQQKQVQEFQEDVLEKARRAKEQAAREALDTQATVTDRSAVNGFTTTRSSTSGSVSKPTNGDLLSRMLSED
ncbi:hypothetical protein ACJIZ3_011935 [Penstemon smallii]|uniref:Uncharacterized protein n=1 Tax=Penstemon smallii TaxID=265156 RepID=A0ABD3UPX4_9LAMI